MLNEQRRAQLDGIVQQMLANKEPDDNIQFVVNDFKGKYENETPAQPPHQSGASGNFRPGASGGWDAGPEQKNNLRNDVTALGSEKAGTVASGLLPRTAEAIAKGEGYGKQVLGAGLDLLSLPGRAIAGSADVATGGQPNKGVLGGVLNSMGDKQGSNFVGRTLRDPATGAAILTAPLTAPATAAALAIPKIGALVAPAMVGAGQGMISATTHQAENVSNDKNINLGQAAMEVGTSAALPVLGQLAGAAKNKIAGLLTGHGEKTVMNTIKPNAKDIADGFKASNVFKHGLDGTLEQTQEKLNSKFADLSSQLADKIKESPEKVDLTDLLGQTLQEMGKDKAATFGKNSAMDNATEFMLNEIDRVAPDGVVNLAEAQQVKRGLGKLGAWQFGKSDPESDAKEALANALYSKLKKTIEDKAPDGVKEINQHLSELIPIERAVIRRLPVAQRNNTVSLSDMITGGIGTSIGVGSEFLPDNTPPGVKTAMGLMGGVLVNRAIKSPRLGAAGYRAGQSLMNSSIPYQGVLGNVLQRGVSTAGFRGDQQ